MEQITRWYMEALVAQIKAIEASRKGLHEGEPEAIESIKRVAHSLRSSGKTYGFPEITKRAGAAEEASKEDLPLYLDKLLKVLREVSSGTQIKKVDILVIDDDPAIALLLKKKLSARNREVVLAETGSAAEKILEERDISLIVLDLFLQDIDGRTILLRLRERPQTAGIPVIVLSTLGGARTKTECFALGADEYFEKPFNANILAAAVAAKLQRTGEISADLRQDPLTKLPNRASFKVTFERMRSFANRVGAPLSIAVLDMDNFRAVNDTYGRSMGDEVLRRTASVVGKSLRKYDSLARFEEEQFVALLPNTDRSGGVRAIEKALLVVSEERFNPPNGKKFFVTFSAGVTEVSQEATVEEVLSEANRLVHLAQASGQNQVLSTEDSIQSRHEKVLIAEDDHLIAEVVKHRLEQEGFEIFHYPDGVSALTGAQETPVDLAIIDVKMPEMDGFELLRRLKMLPSYAHTPIMMLTSMGREKDIVRGFKLGADDYVLKPFSIVELLARVHRLLKRV